MASSPITQSRRRSAGQLQALEWVERQIRECDPNPRRKYLRAFREAFSSYERAAEAGELQQALASSHVVLVGDYHALPASQEYALRLMEQLESSGKGIVLGLEALFARDQRIIDLWFERKISDDELRRRLRFDSNWGFEWQPICQLLHAARDRAVPVYGLDCPPRADFRAIALRDHHAALKIAEIRERHPAAAVLVLFGESHVAPQHLPTAYHGLRPKDRLLTVLQNIETLYWQAAREKSQPVESVLVRPDSYCVFTATPLEKRESYRICLERWRQQPRQGPDLAPAFYNLLDSLLHFFAIDKYSFGRPQLLVDRLPEICAASSTASLESFLSACESDEMVRPDLLRRLEKRGSLYVPQCNSILVRRFQLTEAAEDLARFLHNACVSQMPCATTDQFYAETLLQALTYVASRVLNPARLRFQERDLYAFYSMNAEQIEARFAFNYRQFLRMIDFLVLHKDYEISLRRYYRPPELIEQGWMATGAERNYLVETLGNLLGTQLFDAYVKGKLSRRTLRRLVFSSSSGARELYFDLARRTASRPQRLAA